MSYSLIPLQPLPDQVVQSYLSQQNCAIRVYQRRYGVYIDVYLNNVCIRYGMKALNLNKIIRDKYLGFVGDLVFYDTAGTSDPAYQQIGTRFVLLYDPDA